MSINLDISDSNIKTLIAELPEKMLEYAEEVLLKQAELMKGLAQVYCPVDTGSLRDSVRVERGGSGKHWRGVSVRAGGYVTNPRTGRKVDYAVYVEATQPFMRPAWEDVKPTILHMLKYGLVERWVNK